MNHIMPSTQIVGQFRRFGEFGPVYEVIGLATVDQSGEQRVRLRLVENGEEVDYKLADALQDPFEA